jgi:hypothetical protein
VVHFAVVFAPARELEIRTQRLSVLYDALAVVRLRKVSISCRVFTIKLSLLEIIPVKSAVPVSAGCAAPSRAWPSLAAMKLRTNGHHTTVPALSLKLRWDAMAETLVMVGAELERLFRRLASFTVSTRAGGFSTARRSAREDEDGQHTERQAIFHGFFSSRGCPRAEATG